MTDNPKRAKGTKAWRVNQAIHRHFTTTDSYEEIADDLGVSPETIKGYISEPPAQEVRQVLETQQVQVRMAAFSELKRQLREAGQRSRTAEKPVKVWTDDDGHLVVRDVRDGEKGQIVKKYPLPETFEMGPDHETRFYAREEAREILEQLVDLVGAGEPEQIEFSGEVERGASDELKSLIEEAKDL